MNNKIRNCRLKWELLTLLEYEPKNSLTDRGWFWSINTITSTHYEPKIKAFSFASRLEKEEAVQPMVVLCVEKKDDPITVNLTFKS